MKLLPQAARSCSRSAGTRPWSSGPPQPWLTAEQGHPAGVAAARGTEGGLVGREVGPRPGSKSGR
eukprot:1628069-Lingulodinium_polyedra.AAC.1